MRLLLKMYIELATRKGRDGIYQKRFWQNPTAIRVMAVLPKRSAKTLVNADRFLLSRSILIRGRFRYSLTTCVPDERLVTNAAGQKSSTTPG
jgi:hypothetical protein